MHSPRLRLGLLAGALALTLTACASPATTAQDEEAPAATTVQIEDNNGTHTISLPLTSVVATDNRIFETLDAWGIELTAGAVSLMPDTVSYVNDDSIVDLGTHRAPELENIVAVQPDLILNGQRFAQHHDRLAELAPDAIVLNLDPREGEPLDQELKRQTSVLGEIFGKQAEAKELNDALDAAIARVKDAYDTDDTVMAVITSGGQIGYSAPGNGRTFGPLFDLLGLTPSLQIDNSSEDHQGDDISVEAIAASNPTIMLVMDRDAAVGASDPNYVPGADIIENSEALKRVTAVQDGTIVYMPADAYTNEGIQTYTEFLNALADALESKR